MTAADTAQAQQFLRRSLAQGSITMRVSSPLVQEAVTALSAATHLGAACEHVMARSRADGDVGFAFFPIAGPQSYRLLCGECRLPPDRAAGCGLCDRRPSPGLQHAVHVHPGHGIVLEGMLCRHCRRSAGR